MVCTLKGEDRVIPRTNPQPLTPARNVRSRFAGGLTRRERGPGRMNTLPGKSKLQFTHGKQEFTMGAKKRLDLNPYFMGEYDHDKRHTKTGDH